MTVYVFQASYNYFDSAFFNSRPPTGYWKPTVAQVLAAGVTKKTIMLDSGPGGAFETYVEGVRTLVRRQFPVSWVAPTGSGLPSPLNVVAVPQTTLALTWDEDSRTSGALNFDPTATSNSQVDRIMYTDVDPSGNPVLKHDWERLLDKLESRLAGKYGFNGTNPRPINTYFIAAFPSVVGATRPDPTYYSGFVAGATLAKGDPSGNPHNHHFAVALSDLPAWGWHELGHELGPQHAPFPATIGGKDRDWPSIGGSGGALSYAGGIIGVLGWNPVTNTPVPSSTLDLMAYTEAPQWTSDFLYWMWHAHQKDPTTPGARPFAP